MRSVSLTSGGVLRSLLACQNITKLKQQQPRKAVLRLPEEIAQLVRSQVVLMHLHRSAWALSWERRAPARLQKPRWSVALPAKALTQHVLCKCARWLPCSTQDRLLHNLPPLPNTPLAVLHLPHPVPNRVKTQSQAPG